MKVIDLLNKIANGEKIPKKFKIKHNFYENRIFSYNKKYQMFDDVEDIQYCKNSINIDDLDLEIEIIEEAPEEKLTVSEEQMLFNNLDSIDRERIIQLMKILQPPKANVVISIDYSSCGE